MADLATQNPMYTHTLSEFILSGSNIQVISYPKLCFSEKHNNIVFTVKNILQDYLPELKEMCITVYLSDKEQRKYKYNPKRLAADVYGYTDLYYIILMLNGMIDVREFDEIATLKMLTKSDLNYALSTIYSAESSSILSYNSKHT